jgi:hypothetical protein
MYVHIYIYKDMDFKYTDTNRLKVGRWKKAFSYIL